MLDNKQLHDWMVSYLSKRLSRDYDDVSVNFGGDKKSEFNGHILISYSGITAL